MKKIALVVHLWHGELDNLSPFQNVMRMSQRIHNCETVFLPDAGYFLIENPTIVAGIQAPISVL